MVLHAAYLIENKLPFRQEVSMAKYHVANMLWKITDRAIQVHGALGYSTDTPLESMLRHARSARLVDGADEVHHDANCAARDRCIQARRLDPRSNRRGPAVRIARGSSCRAVKSNRSASRCLTKC